MSAWPWSGREPRGRMIRLRSCCSACGRYFEDLTFEGFRQEGVEKHAARLNEHQRACSGRFNTIELPT